MAQILLNPLFYQEFLDPAKTQPSGNIFVVFPETKHARAGHQVYAAIGRSYPHPFQDDKTPVEANQPVTDWLVDNAFLNTYCYPVTEQEARQIHPYLFASCMDAHLKELRSVRYRKQSFLIGTLVCVIVLFRAFFFPARPISTT